jgi:hypothetical protein
MTWQPYHIVFRLRSPMHIGSGSVGNIQRTRPYVTGRVFWGALTMRIARNNLIHGSATENAYTDIGNKVHECIAYTYFYTAILTDGNYQILWPWDKPDNFKHRLIRSYASTALDYPMQSAAEALLHESEFISPYTLDTAEPVFMTGYIFVNDQCDIDWESALQKLQFGGDRCYGWGDVKLEQCKPLVNNNVLFDGKAAFLGDEDRPVISLNDHLLLLAHTTAKSVNADGDIEPLVGREWRKNGQAGQHVEFTGVCFIPGSTLKQPADFTIGNFGVWQIIKQ